MQAARSLTPHFPPPTGLGPFVSSSRSSLVLSGTNTHRDDSCLTSGDSILRNAHPRNAADSPNLQISNL
jgi:hypothetical protein